MNECENPLRQYVCNENCIWNPSVCASECDKDLSNYTKNVANNLIITLYDTATINTSLSSNNLYYLFFLLVLLTNHYHCMYVVLPSN